MTELAIILVAASVLIHYVWHLYEAFPWLTLTSRRGWWDKSYVVHGPVSMTKVSWTNDDEPTCCDLACYEDEGCACDGCQ